MLYKLNTVVLLIALLGIGCSKVMASDNSWHKSVLVGEEDLGRQNLKAAETAFNQAIVQVPSGDVNDLVQCQNKLANVLSLENKTKSAQNLYAKSLHMLEQKYGNQSIKLVPTLFALGSIYESLGDHNLAMGLYHRGLSINEKGMGPYNPAVAFAIAHKMQSSAASEKVTASLPQLLQEPSLTASSAMAGLVGNYKKDLLSNEDTSEQSLVNEFQSEIVKPAKNDIAFNKEQ